MRTAKLVFAILAVCFSAWTAWHGSYDKASYQVLLGLFILLLPEQA